MGTKWIRSILGVFSASVAAVWPSGASAEKISKLVDYREGEKAPASENSYSCEGVVDHLLKTSAIRQDATTGGFVIDEIELLRTIRAEVKQKMGGFEASPYPADLYENLYRDLRPGMFRQQQDSEGLRSMSFKDRD